LVVRNLPKDKHLLALTKKEEGCEFTSSANPQILLIILLIVLILLSKGVPISELLLFNRLKALSSEPKVIAEAVKDSSLVELNEDQTKMRRRSAIPEHIDANARTIVAVISSSFTTI